MSPNPHSMCTVVLFSNVFNYLVRFETFCGKAVFLTSKVFLNTPLFTHFLFYKNKLLLTLNCEKVFLLICCFGSAAFAVALLVKLIV